MLNHLAQKKRFLLSVLIGIVMLSVRADSNTPDFIQEIVIEGNIAANLDTILYLIKVERGAKLDRDLVRKDIEALYASGYFNDIRAELEPVKDGYRLKYVLTERPVIADIVITGTRAIGLNTLREELTVVTGERYNPIKVRESVTKIEEKYRQKGYHFVVVTPRLTGSQPGMASLVFDVDEGTKLRIRDITINGNDNIRTGNRLWGLKSQLKNNQEWWWFSFISDAGVYNQQMIADDIRAMEQYYKNRGYYRVSISEPQVTLNRPDEPGENSTLSISFDIDEGDVYTLDEIDVKVSDPGIIPVEVVRKLVDSVRLESYQKYFGGSAFFGAGPRFEKGKRYSLALEDEAVKNLSELYGSIGYIYVFIEPEKVIDDVTKRVSILFNIVEGKQAFLNRLEFVGNFRTKDRVLRRNFAIPEGEIFNISAVKSSIARIDYLAYIDEVIPDIQPLADPTKVDVKISLTDNRQTEIQLSGGYSGYNKLYGTLGLSEHNLFGRGQEFNISATSGSKSETFRFSFSDEWIMDRPYYGSVAAWNTREKYDYSTQRKIGGSVFVGRSLGRFLSTRLGYTLERNKVYDISENADESVKDLEGIQVTSSLTHMWILNSLNNRLDPTRGFYGSISAQFAGSALGGDNDFYKTGLSLSNYWELPRKLVFSLQGKLNYAEGLRGKALPFYERYRMGGPHSIRGYEDYSVGPIGEDGDNLGGNKSMQLSAELLIPVAQPLKLVFFIDAGDTWAAGDDIDVRTLRPSTGFEVRFFMPGFGIPLRFIWGYNLDPYDNESINDFQFTMGRSF